MGPNRDFSLRIFASGTRIPLIPGAEVFWSVVGDTVSALAFTEGQDCLADILVATEDNEITAFSLHGGITGSSILSKGHCHCIHVCAYTSHFATSQDPSPRWDHP